MLKRICSNITSLNLSLFFAGLIFLLSFIVAYHSETITTFYPEWAASILGVLALLPMLRKDVWRSFQIPQISLVLIGIIAILVVQWMLGMLHSTQYTLLVFSYLFLAFLLMILGSHLRRELGWERVVITLAWFAFIGGVMNVTLLVLQIAAQSGLAISAISELEGYGVISQAGHFTDYMVLATASLIYLYAKGKLNLKIFSVFLVLFLAAVALPGSRDAWIYLLFLTMLAVLMQVNAMRQLAGSRNMRSLLRMSLLLIPIFAMLKVLVGLFPDALVMPSIEKFLNMPASAPSGTGFWQLWLESWRLFLQSPWLGIGFGQMPWQSFLLIDHSSAVDFRYVFKHSNNLFVHLLTEMGIIAPLLVIAGMAAWLRSFKWSKLSMEGWWLLSLLTVLFVHSMFDNQLWYLHFLCITAVLLGMGEEKLTTINLSKLGVALGQGAFAVVMLAAIINLGSMNVANSMLETWSQHAIKESFSKQDKAKFFNDMNWIHSKSLLAPYAELMAAASLTMDPAQIEDKLEISQSAMQFMPMRKIAYRHVLLLKLQGDEPEAVRQLNRTLIAYPENFTKELEAMPFKYWQDYLDVLSIARPIPDKTKI